MEYGIDESELLREEIEYTDGGTTHLIDELEEMLEYQQNIAK